MFEIKKKENESVQELSNKFMKAYNAIPSEFKPPPGTAQLQYAKAFNSEFTLWLSEIRSVSLPYMLKYCIEVEMNLTASRDKGREGGRRRKTKQKYPPTSSL